MHMLRELSGLIAVRDSYAGFVGMGNGLNKAFTFGVGWAFGWKTSKNNSKRKLQTYLLDSVLQNSKS